MLPGCGGTSALARGETLAACWLHESQPISNQRWDWGFHTSRGGINPGDLYFGPRVVGVVEVWKDFSSGNQTLFSPGAAGSQRWPQGQLSICAGSMNPSQSATSLWGWGFHTVRGGIDPGDLRFRRRAVGVVDERKDFLTGGG